MLHTLRQARAGVTDRLDEARKTNRKLAEAGFTLIELLIVIVILGILAAVVVFSVSGITDRGVASSCKADVASVRTAVEAYFAKEGSYPADVTYNGTGDNTAGAGGTKLVTDLIHSWPKNDQYALTYTKTGNVIAVVQKDGTAFGAGAAPCDGN